MQTNDKWQVSGGAAERYEANLVPVIFIPWALELLKRANLEPGETVLDTACGTGIVARLAASVVGPKGRVVGVDLNGGMLEVARRNSSDLPCPSDWIESDVTALPFDDDSFDALFCQQGLQFFPDKPAALKEFRRVLKTGGRCLVCVAREADQNPLMASQIAALTTHLGPEAAMAIRAVCALNEPMEISSLFEGADFRDVSVESVALTLHHPDARAFVSNALSATPAADAISALPEAKRAELLKDFLDGFGDCFDGKALSFPHVSHVIEARA